MATIDKPPSPTKQQHTYSIPYKKFLSNFGRKHRTFIPFFEILIFILFSFWKSKITQKKVQTDHFFMFDHNMFLRKYYFGLFCNLDRAFIKNHICNYPITLTWVMGSNTPSTAYTPWGPGVMALIFAVSDSWGLLTQISFPEKILWKTVPWRGPKSGTVRFEKNIVFTLNSNIYLNVKNENFCRFYIIKLKKNFSKLFECQKWKFQ